MGCTIRWRFFGPHLPQKTLQKKARELEKVIRLSDVEKNVKALKVALSNKILENFKSPT